MDEQQIRELLVELGKSLFQRGYSVGSAGNISVRLNDGFLMTPTNSSLGRLNAKSLSKLDENWQHISGDKPSKEVFMHRAILTARPQAGAVVHLHSTYATAISCLNLSENEAPIAPLTPYFIMRVGKNLPIIPYYRPGNPAMEGEIFEVAKQASAMLLSNHGSVISEKSLLDAVYAAEELEESARLAIILKSLSTRELTNEQISDLLTTFK